MKKRLYALLRAELLMLKKSFWTSKFGCSNEQFGSSSAAIRFWML